MATDGNETETESDSADRSLKPIGLDSLNWPNTITISRLFLAIILFAIIDYEGGWITAALVFILAAGTDALDGYLARKHGQVTTLGRILDPFADKIIICGSFLFLLEKKVDFEVADGVLANSGVNAWMTLIVLGREMFVTSLRAILEQQGIDFSATMSGKLKMVVQCAAVIASLLSLSPYFATPGFQMGRDILLWSAVAITVYSGLDYVFRAARMIRASQQS